VTVMTFYGEAWPQRTKLTFEWATISWEGDLCGRTELTFSMTQSKVVLRCECERTFAEQDVDRVNEIASHAKRRGQLILDCYGFMSGSGFTLILHSAAIDDGEVGPIGHQRAGLAALCTTYSGDTFGPALVMIGLEPFLELALNDLNSALTDGAQIFVGCGRALDCIRNMFAGADTDRKKAWKAVHRALNITQDYAEFVMNAAKDPRHGARHSGGPHDEVLTRA